MCAFLFGPKNPTKDWQRAAGLQLECDVMQGVLNGVRLGDPLDDLRFLGPIEDRSGLKTQEYRYFSLGLSIGCYNSENIIDCFELIVKDADCPKYHPYAGRCHMEGVDLALHQIREQSLVERFGPPYWKDEDDKEAILFYEWPNLEWQIELAPDGSMNRIIVTRNPLMANRDQRNAYGVDKPWPPEM